MLKLANPRLRIRTFIFFMTDLLSFFNRRQGGRSMTPSMTPYSGIFFGYPTIRLNEFNTVKFHERLLFESAHWKKSRASGPIVCFSAWGQTTSCSEHTGLTALTETMS